jgi:hypothetical protein
MNNKILNASEKLVLISAINSRSGSLLSLRKMTQLGLDQFISAIQTLEQREFLTREIGKFKVQPAAIKFLSYVQNRSGQLSRDVYFASVSVPQLSVSEFFIPNKENFLKDIRNSR